MLHATTADPHSNYFQAGNQYIFKWKNPLIFPLEDCTLLHVNFRSCYDEMTVYMTKPRSDAMQTQK